MAKKQKNLRINNYGTFPNAALFIQTINLSLPLEEIYTGKDYKYFHRIFAAK